MALTKEQRRLRIKRRIRKIISGTAERPRLSVFRSNTQISVQQLNATFGTLYGVPIKTNVFAFCGKSKAKFKAKIPPNERPHK